MFLGGVAIADAPIGSAQGVVPSATDVVANTSKVLVVGADVALGDKIVTGNAGQVQLLFSDQTRLVVGPNSALVVEAYLLRNDNSVGKFTVSALAGTFRFMTGKSNHDAYSIKTPTGTLAVRGTAFDFFVDSGLHISQPATTVMLFRGAVSLCNFANSCTTLSHQCEVGAITAPKAFKVDQAKAQSSGVNLRQRFQYVASQAPLLPDYRVAEARPCLSIESAPLATPMQGIIVVAIKPDGTPIVKGDDGNGDDNGDDDQDKDNHGQDGEQHGDGHGNGGEGSNDNNNNNNHQDSHEGKSSSDDGPRNGRGH